MHSSWWGSQERQSVFYNHFSYKDDIVREIKTGEIEEKLHKINHYHPNLKFTIERETQNSIPFLDMKIMRIGSSLTSTWCSITTDTWLTMNYHTNDQWYLAWYTEFIMLAVRGKTSNIA